MSKNNRNVFEEVAERCVLYAKRKDIPDGEKFWQDQFEDLGVMADFCNLIQHEMLVHRYSADDYNKWSDDIDSTLWWYFMQKRREDLAEFMRELDKSDAVTSK